MPRTPAAADAMTMNLTSRPLTERIATLYPELPMPPSASNIDGPRDTPASALTVQKNDVLFAESKPCPGFPLVLSGELKLVKVDATGRSIELYRIGPGELCIVSASALLADHGMPAMGVATKTSELVILDPLRFDEWTDHRPFRRFVFALFAQRLAEMIDLTEAVAFQKLDQRLANALLGHGRSAAVTHQQLADELGTVREIVTRLLRRFAQQGWLVLKRERIEILNAAALRSLAGGSDAIDVPR